MKNMIKIAGSLLVTLSILSCATTLKTYNVGALSDKTPVDFYEPVTKNLGASQDAAASNTLAASQIPADFYETIRAKNAPLDNNVTLLTSNTIPADFYEKAALKTWSAEKAPVMVKAAPVLKKAAAAKKEKVAELPTAE